MIHMMADMMHANSFVVGAALIHVEMPWKDHDEMLYGNRDNICSNAPAGHCCSVHTLFANVQTPRCRSCSPHASCTDMLARLRSAATADELEDGLDEKACDCSCAGNMC